MTLVSTVSVDSNDTTIYTDGVATHGSSNGGSGIIATTGPQVTLVSTVSVDSNDTTIYTDGVATHGSSNGGSGIIVTTGP